MDSIDIYCSHCASTKANNEENHCMQTTEENGAKFFRRLSACVYRHVGAPYALLNTLCLV